MELIARLGARTAQVSIEREREGGRYRVTIDGRQHAVDARALGPFVRSLLVDGAHHEAAVFRAGEGKWRVGLGGPAHEVEVVDPLVALAREAHGEAGATGRQVVTAYMPGQIVSVAVAAGDAVEPGSSLLVLEAMKMQNEIQADRAGTVVKVHVAAGEAVEGGDPLLEIDAAR
jgi:acetyl/propionyl-CoA carboxylase alpha subunit